MSIQYDYSRTGTERKALVQEISKILGESIIYRKAPTFIYDIGFCSVDKNGVLSCREDTDPEKIEQLVYRLKEQGYEPTNDIADPNTLTIELPKDGLTVEAVTNLKKIIASKGIVLKKALETDNLNIIETDTSLKFPWFTLHGLDGEVKAYCQLVTALCKMAKEQKRVTAKEKDIQNDKFTLRLFLIRLGFIGDEYKTARKILLRNLTGNSSWKSGHRPEPPHPDTGTVTFDVIVTDTPKPENGGDPYGK
ncbi:MAG: hypothetical protein K2N44_01955 [Lachnospiraceae bacterium]|nr:hypothetical protein [Lachnospiraceae bacterium]